jgi:hypothetical protein
MCNGKSHKGLHETTTHQVWTNVWYCDALLLKTKLHSYFKKQTKNEVLI